MTERSIAALLLGCLSFFICAGYDAIAMAVGKRIRSLFALSGLLLGSATVLLLIQVPWKKNFAEHPASVCIGLLFSVLSFVFLIKALFFSFSPDIAYSGSGKSPVATDGLYALCRHPGVLFLILFYFFIAIAARVTALFWSFFLFSVLDIVLAIWEDCRVFPKILDGYDEYKKNTPFLIPKIRRRPSHIKRN